jgi:hypothetical protein
MFTHPVRGSFIGSCARGSIEEFGAFSLRLLSEHGGSPHARHGRRKKNGPALVKDPYQSLVQERKVFMACCTDGLRSAEPRPLSTDVEILRRFVLI